MMFFQKIAILLFVLSLTYSVDDTNELCHEFKRSLMTHSRLQNVDFDIIFSEEKIDFSKLDLTTTIALADKNIQIPYAGKELVPVHT